MENPMIDPVSAASYAGTAKVYTLEPHDHAPVATALTASTGWKCTLEELESAQLRNFHGISMGGDIGESSLLLLAPLHHTLS